MLLSFYYLPRYYNQLTLTYVLNIYMVYDVRTPWWLAKLSLFLLY
jgi:hypothetical protein